MLPTRLELNAGLWKNSLGSAQTAHAELSVQVAGCHSSRQPAAVLRRSAQPPLQSEARARSYENSEGRLPGGAKVHQSQVRRSAPEPAALRRPAAESDAPVDQWPLRKAYAHPRQPEAYDVLLHSEYAGTRSPAPSPSMLPVLAERGVMAELERSVPAGALRTLADPAVPKGSEKFRGCAPSAAQSEPSCQRPSRPAEAQPGRRKDTGAQAPGAVPDAWLLQRKNPFDWKTDQPQGRTVDTNGPLVRSPRHSQWSSYDPRHPPPESFPARFLPMRWG